jgi:hypothetical protein
MVTRPPSFFVAPFKIQDFKPSTPQRRKPSKGPTLRKSTTTSQQEETDVTQVRYRSAIRLRSVWDSIAERYAEPQPLDDEVDLAELSIVDDKGFLKQTRPRPLGFFGLPGERVKLGDESSDDNEEPADDGSDGWETEEESADELGQWDDGPCAIAYEFREERRQRSERLDDLRAFLEAENSTRGPDREALNVPQPSGNLILDVLPEEEAQSDDDIDALSSPSRRADEYIPSPAKKRRLSSASTNNTQLATPPASSSTLFSSRSIPVPLASEKVATPGKTAAPRKSVPPPVRPKSNLATTAVNPTLERARSTVPTPSSSRRQKQMTPMVIIDVTPSRRPRASSQMPKKPSSLARVRTALPTPPPSSDIVVVSDPEPEQDAGPLPASSPPRAPQTSPGKPSPRPRSPSVILVDSEEEVACALDPKGHHHHHHQTFLPSPAPSSSSPRRPRPVTRRSSGMPAIDVTSGQDDVFSLPGSRMAKGNGLLLPPVPPPRAELSNPRPDPAPKPASVSSSDDELDFIVRDRSPSKSVMRRRSVSVLRKPTMRSPRGSSRGDRTTGVSSSDSESDSFDAPPGGRSRSVSVVARRRSVSVVDNRRSSATPDVDNNRQRRGRESRQQQRWTLASVEEEDEPDGSDPMDLLS